MGRRVRGNELNLPYLITQLKDLSLLQSKWGAILNPFLANPSNQASILKNVALVNGTTTVNHKLGEKLHGWRIVGINAAATIYDKQATNQTPDLTLVLVSNAACVASIEVF